MPLLVFAGPLRHRYRSGVIDYVQQQVISGQAIIKEIERLSVNKFLGHGDDDHSNRHILNAKPFILTAGPFCNKVHV